MSEQTTSAVPTDWVGPGMLRAAAERMLTDAVLMRAEMERNRDYWPGADDDSYQAGVRDGLGGQSGDIAASFPPGVLEAAARWLDRSAQCYGVVEYADVAAVAFARGYLERHPRTGGRR